MNNSKKTRKALLSALVALALCFSMFVGTTMAWFTDTASTGVNIITSGNLDLVVEYATQEAVKDDGVITDDEWTELDSTTPVFKEGAEYEPGYTEVVYFRVVNNGSMALKYQLNTSIIDETPGENKAGEEFWLSKHLKAYQNTADTAGEVIVDNRSDARMDMWVTMVPALAPLTLAEAEAATMSSAKSLSYEVSLEPTQEAYTAMVIFMEETVGNEANHNGKQPEIKLGINFVATQEMYEEDSFDNEYDKDAEYPQTVVVSTAAELTNAINNVKSGDTVKLDSDVSVTNLKVQKDVTVDLNGQTITTNAYGGVILDNGASIKNGTVKHINAVAAIKANNVGTIENVTIEITKANANNHITGIAVQQGAGNGIDTIKNVTIKGASQGIEVKWGSWINTLENVKVEAKTIGANNGTALMVDGGRIGKAINCEFNGDVYGVHMFLRGEYHAALEMENCAVNGGTYGIYAHDEAGIANTTNCSLTLKYDTNTTVNSKLFDFEDECKGVVTLP